VSGPWFRRPADTVQSSEEVVTMMAMVLVTMVMVAILAAGVWPVLKDLSADEEDQDRSAAGEPDRSREASSLEGSLVVGLLRHEITPGQYRRAVERLAARDDDANPLKVPPPGGVGHE